MKKYIVSEGSVGLLYEDGAFERVLKPGKHLSASELEAYCRAQMARYKVPSRFEFMRSEDVPLTDTGKVSKRLLQDRFQTTAAATG